MDIEQLRNYCIAKAGVTEEFPFDNETLVFKVYGKMFALAGLNNEPKFANLKCDPERATELREQYDCVEPGYHMSKVHWNSVYFETGEMDDKMFRELIDHSYELVFNSLPKKVRESAG